MKVFISHVDTDTALAQQIAETLRSEGFEVWDYSRVLPGDNPGEVLAEALREGEAMVVLMTPHAAGAARVQAEISYALGQMNYAWRVIPVYTAPPESLPRDDVPWILERFRSVHLGEHPSEAQLHRIAEILQTAPAEPVAP